MTFGAHPNAECRMQQVSMHAQGSEVSLVIDNQTEIKLTTVMPGKQAAYSIAAAAAGAYLLHTSIPAIEDGTQRTLPQPGYLQELPIDRPYRLVFDNAVSPEGVAENLDAMMHFSKNRVLAVLAANLAQPSSWWPVLGEVVAHNADRVVVTDGDVPPGNNAQQIREQLLAGVMQDGAEARTDEVPDRMEAIGRAMSIARRNDTVVIVSGNIRAYRQQGNDRLPWSDVDTIEQLLG
jgi:UDP-N-acetylmuramyl tripeptide synthase